MNGLEDEFGGEVVFERVDVGVKGNELMQTQMYGVRGHPSVVIVSPENVITARFFGSMSEDALKPAIEAMLNE